MDVESQTYKKISSKYRRSAIAGIMCGIAAGGMIAACVIVMFVQSQQAQYPVDYIPDYIPDYVPVPVFPFTELSTRPTEEGWAIICSGDNCRTIEPDKDGNIVINGNRIP